MARALITKKLESVAGLLLICPLIEPNVANRSLPDQKTILEDEKLISEISEPDRKEFVSMAVMQTRRNW